MTPVCPACRAQLRLDAHSCWRCGLNVRPTCAECAEPLMHGMTACWYCRAPVEEPEPRDAPASAEARETVLQRTAMASPPPQTPTASPPAGRVGTATAVPERTTPLPEIRRGPAAAPPAPSRGPKRFSIARVLFGGLLAGLLLAAGMLAIEAGMPRFTTTTPAADRLEERAFDELGLRISIPADWTISRSEGEVRVLSGEEAAGRSTRGFSVASVDVDFSGIDDEATEHNLARVTDYVVVSERRTELASRNSLTIRFTGDNLRYEQWWVDGAAGTVLLEFWSRLADEDALVINSRIARTLELL